MPPYSGTSDFLREMDCPPCLSSGSYSWVLRFNRQRLHRQLAAVRLLELLNLQLGLLQFPLANARKAAALLIFSQKRFQRQFIALHGFNNALQAFQSLFERQLAFLGRTRSLL